MHFCSHHIHPKRLWGLCLLHKILGSYQYRLHSYFAWLYHTASSVGECWSCIYWLRQAIKSIVLSHDDVIKWKHFPRYWPFVWGIHRSPVNSPHKGQWRGALMFSLICARINSWVNNGDLGRNRAHYDVTVMNWTVKYTSDIKLSCPLPMLRHTIHWVVLVLCRDKGNTKGCISAMIYVALICRYMHEWFFRKW